MGRSADRTSGRRRSAARRTAAVLATAGLAWGAVSGSLSIPHAQPQPAKPATPATPPAATKAAAPAPAAAAKPAQAAAAPASAPAEPAPPAAAAVPAPKPTAGEEKYLAQLDAALAPAKGYSPPAADLAKLKEAASAFAGANLDKGRQAVEAIETPLVRKLADWLRLRAGYATAAEYKTFLDQSPDWPGRELLIQRLEEALFTQGGSAKAIRDVFGSGDPKTGTGVAALASAHLAEGDTAKAKQLAARAWRELRIPVTLETGFLERFGKMLEPADHRWRLDRLIVDDERWAKDRKDRVAAARRVIALLPETERKTAEARLAIYNKSGTTAAQLAALPAGEKSDWGLAYHRIQVLRRANRADEAIKLMLEAPVDEAKTVNPDSWWDERRLLAYEAMEAGKPRLAYDLVKDAGPLSVNPLKEQTFMAGWLALRHLKDVKLAIPHFEAMAKAADGPLSRAKSAYWLGRAEEARGNAAAAREHYQRAARNGDTFHGLLSRAKLEPGNRTLSPGFPALPSAEEARRFTTSEPVLAAVAAQKAGLDPAVERLLLSAVPRLPNAGEAVSAMAARLAELIGDTQLSVRIAKAAIARGHNLILFGYPTHAFPAYTPLRQPPETAVLLAIARQESEFNTRTVSGAGARGLLQVMPVTAKHVCTDYKLKCDIPRLLTDKAYNTMMASAYIGDRMSEFQGSYVLTLAGYNAGPGRARQWIRQFGDPRSADVDPLDWIERIPFEETREYVGKVLSNIQVYRARLGEEGQALRLAEDLNRARVAGSGSAPALPKAAAGEKSDPAGTIFDATRTR